MPSVGETEGKDVIPSFEGILETLEEIQKTNL